MQSFKSEKQHFEVRAFRLPLSLVMQLHQAGVEGLCIYQFKQLFGPAVVKKPGSLPQQYGNH
jgi:hypothetical protein